MNWRHLLFPWARIRELEQELEFTQRTLADLQRTDYMHNRPSNQRRLLTDIIRQVDPTRRYTSNTLADLLVECGVRVQKDA